MTAQPDAAPDPGLFGPGSVTWRVHADPTMALAGLRALFLQAVHPLAMAGVAQHSDFRSDPWGRLFRTAEHVGVVTYGTTAEARRAGARVRGIHRRLAGIEPETGTPYRVDDPELLLWVHLCEAESFLSTAVRGGLRVSRADRDRYYAEQVRSAELVGLRAADVPATAADVRDYFDGVRPQLRVTAAARDAALFVLWPPMPTVAQVARPAWVALAGASFALLPSWARRLYRLPGLPTTSAAATAAAVALRTGLLAVPEALRHGPHLKDAQQRMGLKGARQGS
jgi:uncharacterized protein (DUF2236 family)